MNKNTLKTFGELTLGAVTVGAILYQIFKPSKKESRQIKKEGKVRLFISFAKEDENYRNHLVDQARNHRSPFEFIDMSVKNPWPESIWKERCRTKIKGCDGVIVLLSGKTWNSSGARWEVKCAKEEGIPVMGMQIFKNKMASIPPELRDSDIISWSWKNLENMIETFSYES